MKKLGLATALLLAMTGAQAYQFEVQGQSEFYDNTENNGGNFTGGVQGTYYLKNVDTSKGPLAEAAFLNQASNVSVAYNYAEYKAKLADKDKDIQSHNYGVKAEGYVPTKYVPVYASASYSHTNNDSKNNFARDDSGDRYALEVGAVLAPNFLLAAGYTNVPNQLSLDTFGIMKNGLVAAGIESAQAIQDKSDAVTARAKYVGPITGTNMAVGFEAAGTFGEENVYGLKTDLYLNPKLSVGATFLGSDASVGVDQAWGADVNYFITPAVAVGVNYLHANTNNVAYDTDTYGINAKYRF